MSDDPKKTRREHIDPPIFLPFLDNELGYQRSPNTIRERVTAQCELLSAALNDLEDGADAVWEQIPEAQRAMVLRLREQSIGMAETVADLLRAVREMADYNAQATAQRQSARESYDKGWCDRFEDVLTLLHPIDREMLRYMAGYLDDTPPDEPLPF